MQTWIPVSICIFTLHVNLVECDLMASEGTSKFSDCGTWSKNISASYDLEIVNYTGVPLPFEHDKALKLHIRVYGVPVSCSANVSCAWKLFANSYPCLRHHDNHSFSIQVDPREIPNNKYGVHVLVVDVGVGRKTKSTTALLHYEHVVHVNETEIMGTVEGTSTFTASIDVGSNQVNEWSLLDSFCYGQTVDLNFNSGIFYLYSSNGVNSVIRRYQKHRDRTTMYITMGTSERIDILRSHFSSSSSNSEMLSSSASGLTTLTPHFTNNITNHSSPPQANLLLQRNRAFPAVDVYCPNDTQRNTSVEFFIFSNIVHEIEIRVNYGDGTTEVMGQFSGSKIIPHSYQKSGNMTAHFRASHGGTQILDTSCFVTVLDHYCFESSPMFNIRHSVASNPLTVWFLTEVVIKSRKQINRDPEGCGNESTSHVSFVWGIANTENGEIEESTKPQVTFLTKSPGLFKVSLQIKAGQSHTSGILFIRVIFKREVNFANNTIFHFHEYPVNVTSFKLPSRANIMPVYGQRISYTWTLNGHHDKLSLIKVAPESESTWSDILYTNNTNISDIELSTYIPGGYTGLLMVTLKVNYTASIEVIYKFIFLAHNTTGCSTKIYCVENCDLRASKSRNYIAYIEDSSNSQGQSMYRVYQMSSNIDSVRNLTHHIPIGTPHDGLVKTYTHDVIRIDTSRLTSGNQYIVNGVTNAAKWYIILHINTPPVGGKCDVRPKKGFVLQTEFTVECKDWKAGGENYDTPDLIMTVPLRYTVWYQMQENRVVVHRGYESLTPPFVLPSGSPAGNHSLNVTIEIEDRFGDKTSQTLSVSVKEADEGNNLMRHLDSLFLSLNSLLSRFKYTRQTDQQIHIIEVTASEISKIQTNDSSKFMGVTELLSGDLFDLKIALNYSESPEMQKLRQSNTNVSKLTLDWFLNSFLDYFQNGESFYSEKEICHMALLTVFTLDACTKRPEILTPESINATLETLRLLLSENALLDPVLRDTSKSVQATASLMKIVDNVYSGIYYQYFGETDDSMINDDIEQRMSISDSKTKEKMFLIQNLASFQRRRTDQNMRQLSASSDVLKTAILTIEKMMKTTMTGTMSVKNQKFMSMMTKKISIRELRNFSSTVGGVHFEVQSQEDEAHSIDISIAAFERPPFLLANDSLYGSSQVIMLSANTSCNITTQTRNKNLTKLNKRYVSFRSNTTLFYEFAVNLHGITIVYFDFEHVLDTEYVDLYIKEGSMPTTASFDIRQVIRRHQKNYTISASQLSGSRGFLMIVAKGEGERLRSRRDTYTSIGRSIMNSTHGIGVQVFTAGCRVQANAEWVPGGCMVSERSTIQYTVCHCPHFAGHRSFFTSTFYVQPNLIDFAAIVNLSEFDANNAAVYGTLICLLCLYITLVVILRRKDHKDTKKWAPKFLCDNGENDAYYYMITVYTGMRRGSATMSNINFIIVGEEDDSGIRLMSGKDHTGFDAGSVRRFILGSPFTFGRLDYLRIWHDNSGSGVMKSWFLNKVIIDDLQTKNRFIFHCGRWLSLNHDDCKTERVLPVSTTNHLNNFNNRFSERAQFNLTDSHLLVSTLVRPESSNFTRVQRVSCLFVLLLLSMISHAMYFRETPEVSSSQVKIGSLSFSLKDVYISLIVVLITTPPILFASFVFKKSAKRINYYGKVFPRRFSTSSQKYISIKIPAPQLENYNQMFDTEKTLFPGWAVYLAWTALVLAALVSVFFLLLYSLQWGKEKSTRWLINFFLSVLESIFVIDPAKVIFMALVAALFLKSKETQYKLNMDLRHIRRLAKEFYDRNYASINVLRRQILGRQEPTLDSQDLEKFRMKREQEINARRVFGELLTYCVFAFIVLSISYIHTDQRSFLLKNNVNNMLVRDPVTYNKFEKVNRTSEYYKWLLDVVLPQLFPSRDWRNSTLPSSPWFGDFANLRIGSVRLRQVRVADEPCLPFLFRTARPCVRGYQDNNLEIGNFFPKWTQENTSQIIPSILKHAWTYTSEDGIHIPGNMHVYKPGGYIIMFPDNLLEARKLVNQLLEYQWLDRHTRAVFLEMNLYNPNINIFTYTMFIAEFIETGGIVPWSNIWVFRPNEFVGAMGTYAGLCYIVFLVFLVSGTFSVGKGIVRRRLAFLKRIWNIVDLTCILLSYVAIVIFSIRLVKINKTMAKFNANLFKSSFINFQSVFVWDFTFNCIVGVLTFITILRILKILGYNQRLTEIVRVISTAARDLIGFGLVFIIIYTAYVVFGFLIFGKSLREYNTVFRSFGTLTNSLIGKNRLDMMIHVAPEAASFFYFTYSVCVIFTLLTTFSAILNYSIRCVRHQSKTIPETVGIVDILGSSLSNIFGIATVLHPSKLFEGNNSKRHEDNQNEMITSIGIVRLLRDIFVQSLAVDRTTTQQQTRKIQTSRRRRPPRNDVIKLDRIGTLKDIELSVDKLV